MDFNFNDNQLVNLSCGNTISCVTVKDGTLFSWGKGEHEKPKFDDFIEYATPFPMIEDKNIVYVSVGASHVMALDQNGRLYGWGEGDQGCLGFGDGKKRLSVCPISFFENKKVVDVACGDKFTVVIAEVFRDRKREINLKVFGHENASELAREFQAKLQGLKASEEGLKSNRKPLCGGDMVSDQLREKIEKIAKKNRERSYH